MGSVEYCQKKHVVCIYGSRNLAGHKSGSHVISSFAVQHRSTVNDILVAPSGQNVKHCVDHDLDLKSCSFCNKVIRQLLVSEHGLSAFRILLLELPTYCMSSADHSANTMFLAAFSRRFVVRRDPNTLFLFLGRHHDRKAREVLRRHPQAYLLIVVSSHISSLVLPLSLFLRVLSQLSVPLPLRSLPVPSLALPLPPLPHPFPSLPLLRLSLPMPLQ